MNSLLARCRLTPHLPPVAEGASAVLVYCVKLSRCVTFYVRVVSIETLTHIYPNSFSSASAVYTFAHLHDMSAIGLAYLRNILTQTQTQKAGSASRLTRSGRADFSCVLADPDPARVRR